VAGRLYAEALANVLAAHLLSRYVVGRQPERVFSGGLTPSRLAYIIAYILAHLEHTLSLAELAAVAQMSPAHFARLFKQATGRTPHQYVILYRIECAKQLLTETTLSLSEIGARVGYADHSHFTALFRQHVGTTPKIYATSHPGHECGGAPLTVPLEDAPVAAGAPGHTPPLSTAILVPLVMPPLV
jgi:AraC family transcriptional regulator